MARATMADLITQMRGMSNAGTADYTVNGSAYWTDDQVQEVMERYRVDVNRIELMPVPKHVDGSELEYYDYHSGMQWLEQTDGGTAVFVVENAEGEDQGTALWSADYNRGVVTFAADQGGTAYFLTGRRYDLNRAAADMWRMKAAHYATAYDFSTDNHSMKRSQLISNAFQMADMYERNAPMNVVTMYRSDNG